MKNVNSIEGRENSLENALLNLSQSAISGEDTESFGFFFRPGFRPVVELRQDGRKRRKSASDDSWDPATGEIFIYFEAMPESSAVKLPTASAVTIAPPQPANEEQSLSSQVSFAAKEMVRYLMEAESTSGHTFVALKWFRDEFLPSRGWGEGVSERQRVLTEAIESGMIVTSKVANPKMPLYPTTSIRVNRAHPAIITKPASVSRFRPIQVQGEPFSATLLRDRGPR